MTHDISFFVSSNHLAIDTEYGAISETEFRTTTSFSVPANSELRAVSNGHVLLVKQDATIGNSPINIIIKVLDPTKSSPAAKYIIYRNIDAEMFFDGDGGLLRDSDSSEFITELNRPYNPDEVVPESRYFAANADDNTYLEQVFSGDTGLLCVKAGCVFGRIKQSENIGIDIVLYSDFDFDINVGMARRSENVISTLQTTVDHNIISSEKFTKESILRFIDPVVFFNINCKETISYNNDGNASIAKLYLDIRNNLGYSYDYPNSQPTEKLVTVNGSDAQTLSKSRFWPEYTLDVNTIIAEHGECQLQIKKPKYAGGNSLSMILSCQPDNRQLDFGGLQYSEIDDKYIVYIDKSDEEYTPIIKISQLTASTLLRIDILIPPSTDSVAGVPLYQPQHDLDFLMRVPVIPNQESNSQKNHWIINKNHSYFQNLKSLGFGVSGLVEELESNKINYVYFFCPDQYFATDNSCSINEYFPRVSSYNDSKAFDFVSSMYKVNRLTDDMYIPEYRTNNNVNKLVYFICLSEENQIIVQSKLQSFNCTFHDVCLSLRHSTQGTIQDATIVERQLYLVGMSSSGTYTEVDTGIKIYSTDNLIFVSKDYQTVCKQEYDLQTQIPFELHFTLPGDYSSRAHYLFDWMRFRNTWKIAVL